ncbi:hypothetical protein ACA910_021403 [Epithemia clementina (nom. ined.)]
MTGRGKISSSPAASGQPQKGQMSEDGVLDLDQVYKLITDRASGRASTEEVEQAVSQLLLQHQQRDEQGFLAASPSASSASALKNRSSNITSDDDKYKSTSTNEKDKIQSDKKTANSKEATITPIHDETASSIIVQEDTENYDDEEEEGGNDGDSDGGNIKKAALHQNTDARSIPKTRKRGRPAKNKESIDQQAQFNPDLYDDIPLGCQGARMMIVFGDGRCPNPEAVRATLLGTRRMMLVAIQDARQTRRKSQALYQQAKSVLQRKGGGDLSFISPQLLYQLQQKDRHPVANNPPCGFGPEDLVQLFPEEMNAYIRWNQMKEEADDQKAAADEDEEEQDAENGGNDPDNDDEEQNPLDGSKASAAAKTPPIAKSTAAAAAPAEVDDQLMRYGHLWERAQVFDARTSQMKKDWYLKFSAVRHQGSFLPRRNNRTLDPNATEWEEHQSMLRRGRQRAGAWAHMPFVEVRFLHWLGFEPTTNTSTTDEGYGNDDTGEAMGEHGSLPPPNSETTAVLAFLAHDFFGRIVEKAIELRDELEDETCKKNCKEKCRAGDEEEGDDDGEDDDKNNSIIHKQLAEQDIARAMEHADIKPIPIFSSRIQYEGQERKKHNVVVQVGTQLYFGPGFEDRVELELEAMTNSARYIRKNAHKNENDDNDGADDEEAEVKWRIKEDLLFERLAAQQPSAEDDLLQQRQVPQDTDPQEYAIMMDTPTKSDMTAIEAEQLPRTQESLDDSTTIIQEPSAKKVRKVAVSKDA